VFSTKNREPFLRDLELRSRVHAYLVGTLKGLGCEPIRVGGVADHAHILTGLGREITIATLVKELKTSSNSLLKRNGQDYFAWQVGYGAFSVSHSARDAVDEYIRQQESHHRKISFQDEFRQLLARHGIAFEEKYLWS